MQSTAERSILEPTLLRLALRVSTSSLSGSGPVPAEAASRFASRAAAAARRAPPSSSQGRFVEEAWFRGLGFRV